MKLSGPRFLAILLVLALGTLVLAPSIGITQNEWSVVSMLRIPRVLLAFMAGGTLALCGMVFQALFRNPLATPFTLGVSSGAAFGAAATILFGAGSAAFVGIPVTVLGALGGAGAAMMLVYVVSLSGRSSGTIMILLGGVAISFIFSSLLMFLQYLSDSRHSFQIIRWLMGGLEIYGYRSFAFLVPALVLGISVIAIHLPHLNLLLTGDDLAASRGIRVGRTRTFLYFASSLCISAVVSLCGPVGFVGMMAPHVCRMVIGNDHRYLGPCAFLAGGIFLTVCDTVARIVIAPAEIPVGVLTALCGGPFFLWFLFSSRKSGGLSAF